MEKNQKIPVGLRVFSWGVLFVTWLLMILGGVVHGTGSSLACPDWPTCHGSFFPEMVGGVLIEHSHRVLAASVGFFTILLCLFYWKRGREFRRLCLGALALVVFQGVLGGVTVLLHLPAPVSISHLGISMIFFALILWIALKATFSGASLVSESKGSKKRNSLLWIAAGVLYLQIVLGAAVRHLGAGLACVTLPLCEGSLWPGGAPLLLKVHMAHRWGGVLVALLLLAHALKTVFSRTQSLSMKFFSGLAVFLVLAQITLGWFSVSTALGLVPISLHLAVGALLWATVITMLFTEQRERRFHLGEELSEASHLVAKMSESAA